MNPRALSNTPKKFHAAAQQVLDYHERQTAETNGCQAEAFSCLECKCLTRPVHPAYCPFKKEVK